MKTLTVTSEEDMKALSSFLYTKWDQTQTISPQTFLEWLNEFGSEEVAIRKRHIQEGDFNPAPEGGPKEAKAFSDGAIACTDSKPASSTAPGAGDNQ